MPRVTINTRPRSADKNSVSNQSLAKIDSDSSKVESKIDYQAMELARTGMLQAQLKNQLRSMEAGRDSSLRKIVLRYVVEGKYPEAASTIDEYLDMKNIYPAIAERCVPHASHAKELINAVRAKRDFPGLSSLSMSKQQEILDHAIGHFEELKFTLKTIEYLVRDEAIKDTRSTVWVLQSLVYAVMAIVGALFLLEFSGSMGRSMWVVFNDFADTGYKLLAQYIPFL
jgi:hypothetical protein